MIKRQEYSERVVKMLNFESRIYSDFAKLCAEEKVYPSHKIQEMMIAALQKKVEGEPNPLNLRGEIHTYISSKPKKPSLDDWITEIQEVANDENALNMLAGQHKKAEQTATFFWKEAKKRRMLQR